MIVYQETKQQFLDDVRLDLIEEKIEEKVREKLHKKTAYNEFLSWMNSMQYMYKVMEDKRIPKDSKIAIEYRIPNSNKRVDFIICGGASLCGYWCIQLYFKVSRFSFYTNIYIV